MRRFLLVATSFLVLLVLARPVATVSGTSSYTDCYGSGKCGDVSDEDTCSGFGTCPQGTWVFAEDEDLARCAYTYAIPTAGTPEEWVLAAERNCLDNDCDSYTGTAGCSISASTTTSETATSSFDWGFGVTLKGELNVALVASVGIEVEGASTSGTSQSSSESVSYSDTCAANAPGCERMIAYRLAFRRVETASTDVAFVMQVKCEYDGEICDNVWHTQPWEGGSCVLDADLTVASTDSVSECKKCDLLCTQGELHPWCQGCSSTAPGTCDIEVYGGPL